MHIRKFSGSVEGGETNQGKRISKDSPGQENYSIESNKICLSIYIHTQMAAHNDIDDGEKKNSVSK